jgi:hypothetical protein
MKLSDIPGDTSVPSAPTRLSGVPESEPAVEQPGIATSLWQGLLHGLGNPAAAMRQLGSRAPGAPAVTGEDPQAADAAIRQRDQDYRGPYAPGPGKPLSPARANPTAAGIGEFLGEAAMTIPLALGASRGGAAARVGIGAATGGAAGALNPVTSERDFWTEKAAQTGLGAAVGGALGGAGAALSPRLGVDATEMARRGINLTPGMRTEMQGAERKLQAFPILRGYLEGKVGRSVDDFNRAAIRQALEPTGLIMSRSVPAGHDMIKYMDKTISSAYDRVLPQLAPVDRATVDAAIKGNPELQKLMTEMAPDDLRRLISKIDNRILGRFDPQTGTMDGPLFKKVDSDLGEQANSFRKTEIGDGLRIASEILYDAVATANPALAPVLKNVDTAYAMSMRLKDAAARRANSGGKFTPEDMLEAIKNQDHSRLHAEFAKGDSLMQEFAELGDRVMGRSVRRYEDPSVGSQYLGAIPGAIGGTLYPLFNAAQRHPSLGATTRAGAPAAGGAAADLAAPRERRPRTSTAGP